jgi:hypothetical protein
MTKIEEQIKVTKGGEDGEAFEGDIELKEIEDKIVATIDDAKKNGGRSKFVFKDFKHETEDQFIKFVDQFGIPDFSLFMTCEERSIKERWMKKNDSEDVPEEEMDRIKSESAANAIRRNKLCEIFNAFGDRSNIIHIDTSKVGSVESLSKELNNNFSAKVVLVNHEKSIPIDNVCSNVAIKYNMLYISAYQVIKKHILEKTVWGEKLDCNRKNRDLIQEMHQRDEHEEILYSPVHFDLNLVMQLLKETVNEKTTN